MMGRAPPTIASADLQVITKRTKTLRSEESGAIIAEIEGAGAREGGGR
jgi:hypothetical protein